MLGTMTSARRFARPALAAALATALAASATVACNRHGRGTRLGGAGTPHDDGSGVLARASIKFMTSTDEGGFEPSQDAARTQPVYDYGYGYTYGGFGGDWYGGFGGSPYASYQPYVPYQATQRVPEYAVSYATDHGAIEGRVVWPKPPRAPESFAAPTTCDGPIENRSLQLGGGNAVEGAVVYLEKIVSGRATPPIYAGYGRPVSTGGTVEVHDCALTPTVQILMPVPGHITVTNDGGAPRTLVAEKYGDATTRVEQRLEAGGTRRVPVSGAGLVRIADASGALPPAWIIPANHPYFTLTDDRGRFRLDDVVPGDYTLVIWHPPVITGSADGALQYAEPVVVKKKVTVRKTAASEIEISLP